MDTFIENSIKKTKILLQYFGYVVSEDEIFILSDLYKLRFSYDEYRSSCPLETASFRLFFFINHFMSCDATKFCDEIFEMKVTKNYPFPIVFRCGNKGEFAIIMGIRRKDKKIILFDKDNNMVLSEFDALIEGLNGRIEWWVIMPPQKRVSVAEVIGQCAYKSIRYMINMVQSDRVDRFYETGYLKNYIRGVLNVAESKNDYRLKELLGRYVKIVEDNLNNQRADETIVLKELFEYMG